MDISIVTGTLNRKKILKDVVIPNTVELDKDVELILLDGGSSDGTIEYINHLSHPRIKLIQLHKRSSYSNFMNIGVQEALSNSETTWIAQWNDDVYLECSWKEVRENFDHHSVYLFSWKRAGDPDYHHWDGCLNFGIYNKNIIKKIGYYDERFRFYGADYDFTQRMKYFNYDIKVLPHIKVTEVPRQASSPDTFTGQDDKFAEENISFYKKGVIPKWIKKI